jgi:hypothetical protein
MRPDASPDPAVESLEELADVGAFVILTPAPQERIKPRDQFLGFQRCRPFSPLPRTWSMKRRMDLSLGNA